MKKNISIVLALVLATVLFAGVFPIQAAAAYDPYPRIYSADGRNAICITSYDQLSNYFLYIRFYFNLQKPYDWTSFTDRQDIHYFPSFLSAGMDSLVKIEKPVYTPPWLSPFPSYDLYAWLKMDDPENPQQYIVQDMVNDTLLLTTVEGRELLFDMKTGDLLSGEVFVHYSQADLEALIAQAAAIEKGNYTDATWDALQAAIAAAQPISTGQALRNEQYNALQTAIDGLLENPEPPEPGCGCCDDHNHSNSFADRLACFFCKIIQFFRRLFSIV